MKQSTVKIIMMTGLSVIAVGIIVAIVLVIKKHRTDKETLELCVCREAVSKDCIDRAERLRMYESGQLTEFTPQKYVYHNPMPPETEFQPYNH